MAPELKSQVIKKFKDIPDIQNQLYNAVVSGDQDYALKLTIDIINIDASSQIINIKVVVKRLLSNRISRIFAYAYKLWHSGKPYVVKNSFPFAFQSIYEESPVMIIDSEFQQPMKLNDEVINEDEREACTDGQKKDNDATRWKYTIIWENDMYFKICNIKYKQYLKLGTDNEKGGMRQAFGSEDDGSDTFKWRLVPAHDDDNLICYIYNKKYDMSLKLGASLNPNDDRIVWGHKAIEGEPEAFKWLINK